MTSAYELRPVALEHGTGGRALALRNRSRTKLVSALSAWLAERTTQARDL
jgi:hypothetical protein